MRHSQDNRLRVFADLVSIDAWYTAFDRISTRADLHVDATFRKNIRLGGEEESKVRFRLSIRGAELIVIVPEHEPLLIDKSSIARGTSLIEGRHEISTTKHRQGVVSGSVGAKLPGTSVSITADAEVSGKQAVEHSEKTTLTEPVRAIIDSHGMKNGNNSWLLEPGPDHAVLVGKPWDAITAPRLTLVDTRRKPLKSLDHAVHIQIRCFGDDLIIDDVELKDSDHFTLWPKQKNRIVAAQAYIRYRLQQTGLFIEPNAVVEKFCEIVIAEITATPIPRSAHSE